MDVLALPPDGVPLPKQTDPPLPAQDGLVIERLADTEYTWPVDDDLVFIVRRPTDLKRPTTVCFVNPSHAAIKVY